MACDGSDKQMPEERPARADSIPTFEHPVFSLIVVTSFQPLPSHHAESRDINRQFEMRHLHS